MEMMTVSVQCDKCDTLHVFDVSQEGLQAWMRGDLIQNALGELTPEQRELLISSTCDRCWARMFRIDLVPKENI